MYRILSSTHEYGTHQSVNTEYLSTPVLTPLGTKIQTSLRPKTPWRIPRSIFAHHKDMMAGYMTPLSPFEYGLYMLYMYIYKYKYINIQIIHTSPKTNIDTQNDGLENEYPGTLLPYHRRWGEA